MPNELPPPRLLETAATEQREEHVALVRRKGRSRVVGPVQVSGNGRAIVIGILLGGLAISAAGYALKHQGVFGEEFTAVRKFFAVRTRSVSKVPTGPDYSAEVDVHISPKLLRVTAIALGHPRLAIINGEEVVEGQYVTVDVPGMTIQLRVVEIRDGRIELANGSQIVTARLPEKPGAPQ